MTEHSSIYSSILDMIGHTPLVKVNHIDTGPCELYLKLELANPGGSIKDRIGLHMIEQAEKRGDIRPGDTLLEATAGNTGIALALVAAQKNYSLIIVLPDKMSAEKIAILRAMGAEVIITRSDVQRGHPEYYQDLGARLAKERGAYFINQFANPDNVAAHKNGTAPELWAQLDHQIDAVIVGVGSSGTVSGFSQYIKETGVATELVIADPEGSILAEYIASGQMTKAGKWLVEGIGEDFLPDIHDFSAVTSAYCIPDKESFLSARLLLRQEGIMAGSSSGTLLAAALRYCREQKTAKRVVTFACDIGDRYLSKLYNDQWLQEKGFVE